VESEEDIMVRVDRFTHNCSQNIAAKLAVSGTLSHNNFVVQMDFLASEKEGQ
jgi:hypothetical protein